MTSLRSPAGARRESAWPFEGCYRASGYAFRVRTHLPEVGELLDLLLTPFRVADLNGVPVYSLLETGQSPRPYSLFLDEDQIQRVEHPASMIDWVLANVTARGIAGTDAYVAVHAGVVARADRAVILPAPPDSGKTTMTAALVRAGFSYLSDEAALIDPQTGLVHPFPRPLIMDRQSVDALGGLLERLPARHIELMRYRYHLRPEDLGSDGVGEPATPALVVAPAYDPGRPTALTPMSPAEGLLTLAQNSFNLDRLGVLGFGTLARLAGRVRFYRLRLRELDSAVRAVVDLLTGDREDVAAQP